VLVAEYAALAEAVAAFADCSPAARFVVEPLEAVVPTTRTPPPPPPLPPGLAEGLFASPRAPLRSPLLTAMPFSEGLGPAASMTESMVPEEHEPLQEEALIGSLLSTDDLDEGSTRRVMGAWADVKHTGRFRAKLAEPAARRPAAGTSTSSLGAGVAVAAGPAGPATTAGPAVTLAQSSSVTSSTSSRTDGLSGPARSGSTGAAVRWDLEPQRTGSDARRSPSLVDDVGPDALGSAFSVFSLTFAEPGALDEAWPSAGSGGPAALPAALREHTVGTGEAGPGLLPPATDLHSWPSLSQKTDLAAVAPPTVSSAAVAPAPGAAVLLDS
jgi:hypothetical protein